MLSVYKDIEQKLSFWHSESDAEVDLIIERYAKKTILIEIKSKTKTSLEDARHLLLLGKKISQTSLVVLSQDTFVRKEEGVSFYPWELGIQFILET